MTTAPKTLFDPLVSRLNVYCVWIKTYDAATAFPSSGSSVEPTIEWWLFYDGCQQGSGPPWRKIHRTANMDPMMLRMTIAKTLMTMLEKSQLKVLACPAMGCGTMSMR